MCFRGPSWPQMTRGGRVVERPGPRQAQGQTWDLGEAERLGYSGRAPPGRAPPTPPPPVLGKSVPKAVTVSGNTADFSLKEVTDNQAQKDKGTFPAYTQWARDGQDLHCLSPPWAQMAQSKHFPAGTAHKEQTSGGRKIPARGNTHTRTDIRWDRGRKETEPKADKTACLLPEKM